MSFATNALGLDWEKTVIESLPPAAVLLVLGRALMGLLFVSAGLGHLKSLDEITERIRARGAPFPRTVLLIGTAFEIAAGAMLMLGLLAPFPALGLVIFVLVAGLLLLDFWNKQGEARQAAANGWRSNLGLIGGLLVAAAAALG